MKETIGGRVTENENLMWFIINISSWHQVMGIQENRYFLKEFSDGNAMIHDDCILRDIDNLFFVRLEYARRFKQIGMCTNCETLLNCQKFESNDQ